MEEVVGAGIGVNVTLLFPTPITGFF